VVTALLFDLLSLQAAEQLGVTIPINALFGTVVMCWLISNEGLSITENLSEIGVPAPKFLKVALEGLREFFERMTQKKE
jgi:phage-related holin